MIINKMVIKKDELERYTVTLDKKTVDKAKKIS